MLLLNVLGKCTLAKTNRIARQIRFGHNNNNYNMKNLRNSRIFTSLHFSTLEKNDSSSSKHKAPARFFDSREKYLVFCTTTSEKWRVGERVISELDELNPSPPSINIFDAGLGDAAVLTRVLRGAHGRFPSVPILAVAKEISLEDVRQSLIKLPDRFSEHPQTVLAVTNMTYKAAPGLQPLTKKGKEDLTWIEMPLKGTSAIDFERQIEEQIRILEDKQVWNVRHSADGNPLPAKPCVIVIYREDQRFTLDNVLPQASGGLGQSNSELVYDLSIASQPFRSRASAESKCKNVLMPLVASLKPEGRLVVVQSTGHDPGMEIVRNAWPDEEPFKTPGHILQAEMLKQIQDGPNKQNLKSSDFIFSDGDQFRYELHSLPDDATDSIGTSVLLAAWNAATYVAQVDTNRSDELVLNGRFQDCVNDVLQKYGRLWFTNEAFVVSKKKLDF